MNKQQFLQQFQLKTAKQSVQKYPFVGKLKPSAVLIPLIEQDKGLNVLLTKRANNLNNHAGQISFPGGRYDDSDTDLIDTAKRESFEEIGLESDCIQVVGTLSQYTTISGYSVTPVVSFVEQQDWRINHDEVDEVFQVPFNYLLNRNNIHQKVFSRKNRKFTVYFIPYHNHTIWGVTAALLVDLINHIEG